MRFSIFLVGGAAVGMAISVGSVYSLWTLSSDLVYVILFPQLLCAIHFQHTNTVGSLLGFIIGLFVRLSGGEPVLGIPVLIKYPWYDETRNKQYFPFKTMSMLITLLSILIFSIPLYIRASNAYKVEGVRQNIQLREQQSGRSNEGFSDGEGFPIEKKQT